MTTQVIFKIDKRLKDKAMAKAKHEGVSFASILKLATKAFVEGDLTLGLVGSEKFNAKTAREVKRALNDISEGNNLSPSFTSAKNAIKFLKD